MCCLICIVMDYLYRYHINVVGIMGPGAAGPAIGHCRRLGAWRRRNRNGPPPPPWGRGPLEPQWATAAGAAVGL